MGRPRPDLGLETVTVSHPFLMAEVKRHTSLKLSVSTICEIMNARAAEFYEELGADIIIPSMNINTNVNELRTIKKALKNADIRIMVNEHCLRDCPWRRAHHNHFSLSETESDLNFLYECRRVTLGNESP
jgi:collagenase-like PrtC family protease